ncbi:MAG: hypothetical protein JHC58_00980, partial [Ilumatobacteraceae bacterium]|nr:hypothetical protein [Ilumatobacteraceae bacterium]
IETKPISVIEPRNDSPTNVLPFDREKFEDDASEPVNEPVRELVNEPVSELVIEPEILELVVEAENIVPVIQNSAPTIADEQPAESDDGHRAKIVQMFGRTSRRLHPSTETPEVDQTAPTVPEAKTPELIKKIEPKKSSVDDLFAKLRQAGAENVASSVKTVKDSSHKTTETPKKAVEPPKPIEPDLKMFERRDSALIAVDEMLVKKLKRVLADEENAMLNYLQSKKAQVALEKVLPSFENQLQTFVEATSKELIEAAMSGAQSLSKSLKSDLRKKISNATVMQVLSKKLADDIVYPLRERIQKCVEGSDGSASEMSSLIRSTYREWKMKQVDKIVGDISRLAYSRGAYLVLETGVKVCWMVDPNGPPCADAEDNSLAGEVNCGEKFPTGDEHPVIHAGCKCLVVPSSR